MRRQVCAVCVCVVFPDLNAHEVAEKPQRHWHWELGQHGTGERCEQTLPAALWSGSVGPRPPSGFLLLQVSGLAFEPELSSLISSKERGYSAGLHLGNGME